MNTTSKVFVAGVAGVALIDGGLTQVVFSAASAAVAYHGNQNLVGSDFNLRSEELEQELDRMRSLDEASSRHKEYEEKLRRSKKVIDEDAHRIHVSSVLLATATFINPFIGLPALGLHYLHKSQLRDKKRRELAAASAETA